MIFNHGFGVYSIVIVYFKLPDTNVFAEQLYWIITGQDNVFSRFGAKSV